MNLDYSEILPGLYLGNAASQKKDNRPTNAACCLMFGLRDTGAPKWAKKYCFCELEDRTAVPAQYVLQELEKGRAFIESCLSEGVLVHCGLGVSRSAACVCLYVMKALNMGYDEAVSYVRQRRPCVNPNDGFASALRNM